MSSTIRISALAVALVAAAACSTSEPPAPGQKGAGADASLTRDGFDQPGVSRQYGKPVKLGNGKARAYVVIDQKNGGVPLEIGMALDEKALDGLPGPTMASMKGDHNMGHVMENEFLLPLPERNPTPFRLLALNWNPAGHEPPGIYDIPHFDFHFNTISLAERNLIDPSLPGFQAKADKFPAAEFIPTGWKHLPGPPNPALAIPMMGVHFMELASPELQPPGSPNHQVFTKTYIWGSWDGKVIFQEPMITLAYLRSKPNATIPITLAQKYSPAGYYPSAYRVVWDNQARETRVALSQLAWRQ